MRAMVRATILLGVLILVCGPAAAQSQDLQENPPDDPAGPGGGDEPTPWPLLISFQSSGPVGFIQGPDTGVRYLERAGDATYLVNLGRDDVFRAVWRDPLAVAGITIQNGAKSGDPGGDLELTWYDEAGAVSSVQVLPPGASVEKPLSAWAKVEIRDAGSGAGL